MSDKQKTTKSDKAKRVFPVLLLPWTFFRFHLANEGDIELNKRHQYLYSQIIICEE